MAMLVCMAVTLFSCSKDDEEVTYTKDDLVGTWKITSIETDVIGADGGTNIPSTLEYEENSVFVFSADDKYSVMSENAATVYQAGNWKLEGGKKLVLKEDSSKEFEILALNDESATLYYKFSVAAGGVEAGFSETVTLKSSK